jgi:site-specific DNA-cytosine methylase
MQANTDGDGLGDGDGNKIEEHGHGHGPHGDGEHIMNKIWEAEEKVSPLRAGLKRWSDAVPPPFVGAYRAGVEELSTLDFDVGTAFSGSGMVEHALNLLVEFWKKEYNLQVRVRYRFACEIVDSKRRFLDSQFHMDYLFSNAMHLCDAKAYCTKAKTYVAVPSVDFFGGGFSCKSKSRQNNSRPKVASVIRDAPESETAQTWEMTKNYILSKKPLFIALENVMDCTRGGSESDCEEVLKALRKYYCMDVVEIPAQDYGSVPIRNRLYFIGYRMSDKVLGKAKLRLVKQLLQSFVIPKNERFGHEEFLVPRFQFPAGNSDEDSGLVFRQEKAVYEAAEYKVEHMAAFDVIKEPWPPSSESLSKVVSINDIGVVETLSRRGVEVLYWTLTKFPEMAEDCDVEFLNWNMSLKRLAGEEFNKNPFEGPHAGTLLGTTKLLMRVRNPKDHRGWGLRALGGLELLSFAGFHLDFVKNHMDFSDDLLGNLAGNAFSGFAIGPLLVSALPLIHLEHAHFNLPKPETKNDASSDSEDSSKSSSSD